MLKRLSTCLIFSLVTSCGSFHKTHKSSDSQTGSAARKAQRIKEKFSDKNYGPTQKSDYFVDVAKDVGLDRYKASRFYIYDLDNDNNEDIVILEDGYSTPLFLVQTKSGFSRAKNIFFEKPIKASFLNFIDMDKDGVVDVLVAVHNQKTELSRTPLTAFKGVKNRGNLVFKEFPNQKKLNFKTPISSVSIFDYDYDGNLDFFIGHWYDTKKKGGAQLVPDRLMTIKNKKVYDVSGALSGELNRVDGFYKNATPTYGVSHCDIDGNGIVDILTTSSSGYPNKMWLGEYAGENIVYKNYGLESRYAQDGEGLTINRGGGNSTYSICTDYNNDGIMDIALGEITHSYDNENRDRSSILTGEGLGFPPTFIRTEYTSDFGFSNWNQGDQRGGWLDFNNDGLQDLFVENTGFPPHSRLILFKQESDHAYVDFAKSLGVDIVNPTGTVFLDYNNDGKLDILTSQSSIRDKSLKPKIFLFENRGDFKGNSISILLEGKKSNRDGIGSKVIVRTKDGNEYSRWHQTNYGPLPSQNSQYIHVGIGESEVKEIEVLWPFKKDKKQLRKIYYPPFIKRGSHTIIKE